MDWLGLVLIALVVIFLTKDRHQIYFFDIFRKKDGFKIGDYVKIREDSLYAKIEHSDEIYKIDRMDNVEAYLKTIDDDYPNYRLCSIPRPNLRKLTDSEKVEFEKNIKEKPSI
jgi:hypothetical protein